VRSSGQGQTIQVQRDVVPDADRRGNLGQHHPRSHITYPQATRTRVPSAESHRTSELDGVVQASRSRRISLCTECRGGNDFRFS
jgi:hypothetical protein